MNHWSVAVILLVGLVGVILEIASGVGYLGQEKFLGYSLGNAFAILGVISNLLSAAQDLVHPAG